MYILQESRFSFEELQILESKDKLPIFFSALDLRLYAKHSIEKNPILFPAFTMKTGI